MSYFDRLLHFYQVAIEQAYELEADYNYSQAKLLRKSINQKQKQVAKLIHDYESSLQLVSFNSNDDVRETIENQLAIMQSIESFNLAVLEIEVKTKTGYYMFIKDMIAHSHLLPF